MCRLLETALYEIEQEAIADSLRAKACAPLLRSAEELQKILIEHGCRYAEPTYIRYGAVMFFDFGRSSAMVDAIRAAGLEIAVDTIDQDAIGTGYNRVLQLADYPGIRISVAHAATKPALQVAA